MSYIVVLAIVAPFGANFVQSGSQNWQGDYAEFTMRKGFFMHAQVQNSVR